MMSQSSHNLGMLEIIRLVEENGGLLNGSNSKQVMSGG
jgi:hypothetical protein